MHRSLLRLLCCPSCAGDLSASPADRDEIVEGELCCLRCGRRYPIRGSIPRIVSDESYAGSFGYEWNVHPRVQLQESSGPDHDFFQRSGLNPGSLNGKLVLDAGCGMGRHIDVVAPLAREVVGVDLSRAVDAAHQNEGYKPNVHIVQAAIGALPFRSATFDLVYSIGVLHHTPDTREAFRNLVPLLKDGGEIAIWVYDGHDPTAFASSDLLRRATTRLPASTLHRLAHVAVPLYHLYRDNPLRPLLIRILPISMHPDPEWRVLDTFDWYSPKYQWRHRFGEVYTWFKEAGIERVALAPYGVGMHGRKRAIETTSPRVD